MIHALPAAADRRHRFFDSPSLLAMWAHILNALLGIWLMIAPAVLAYGAPARRCGRSSGPVIAMFAVIDYILLAIAPWENHQATTAIWAKTFIGGGATDFIIYSFNELLMTK